MPKETVYFSYPAKYYHTRESVEIAKWLEEVYGSVIDPEDLNIPKFKSCKQCLTNILKWVLFPKIEECTLFALWPASPTCQLSCELHYAWTLGKRLVLITYNPQEIEEEDITPQEYHTMELMLGEY